MGWLASTHAVSFIGTLLLFFGGHVRKTGRRKRNVLLDNLGFVFVCVYASWMVALPLIQRSVQWLTCYGSFGVFMWWAGGALCCTAVTGGIGSGKSTVMKHMMIVGWTVIDSDAVSREILIPKSPAYQKLVKLFGRENIVNSDTNEIDRNRLRKLVFDDPQKRAILNKVTHWYIIRRLCWLMFYHRIICLKPNVVVDVPLLFECGLERLFYPIITVTASNETRLARLVERDATSDVQTLRNIIDSQMPLQQKTLLSEAVIHNDSTLTNLQRETRRVLLSLGLPG